MQRYAFILKVPNVLLKKLRKHHREVSLPGCFPYEIDDTAKRDSIYSLQGFSFTLLLRNVLEGLLQQRPEGFDGLDEGALCRGVG